MASRSGYLISSLLYSLGAPKEAQNYCSLTIPALERKCGEITLKH
jgi:hypothetical protein